MQVLEALAEARIEEAMRAGEFDNLPGAGRPLELDDDSLIPPDLRVAYRILKNARFVPPEVETRREVMELHALLATLDDEAARRRAVAKLALLEARLERTGVYRSFRNNAYYGKLLDRLGG